MRANSASAVTLTPSGFAGPLSSTRSAAYDGLVGRILDERTLPLTADDQTRSLVQVPEDVLHGISVICGYTGLVAGFAFLAAIMTR